MPGAGLGSAMGQASWALLGTGVLWPLQEGVAQGDPDQQPLRQGPLETTSSHGGLCARSALAVIPRRPLWGHPKADRPTDACPTNPSLGRASGTEPKRRRPGALS